MAMIMIICHWGGFWTSMKKKKTSVSKVWQPFHFKDRIGNSPYCLPYTSYDISMENLIFRWNNFLIEKSEPQMGLEPTTLRDLVGCSNHWATGDSMVSEGQFVGLDWNRIARLHSQVLVSTCENSLTASRCHIKAYQDAANQPPNLIFDQLIIS